MRIPKRIKISGMIWQVIFNTPVTTEGNCYGSTHTASQIIYISPLITKQAQDKTFIHEILHALWWQAGLNNRFDNKTEEEIVQALSFGIYQVMKDNKLLKE